MIGRLSGRIDYRASDHVLLDVGGVGYVVFVSERTLAALPGTGEAASLYTDLLVREDLLQLFGFTTPAEREWHRLLMGVQGIGARASMAILGTLGADAVARAIAGSHAGSVTEPVSGAAWQAEALSALQNLGYAPGEASTAVAEAAGMTEDADTATLIREALKRLAPKA